MASWRWRITADMPAHLRERFAAEQHHLSSAELALLDDILQRKGVNRAKWLRLAIEAFASRDAVETWKQHEPLKLWVLPFYAFGSALWLISVPLVLSLLVIRYCLLGLWDILLVVLELVGAPTFRPALAPVISIWPDGEGVHCELDLRVFAIPLVGALHLKLDLHAHSEAVKSLPAFARDVGASTEATLDGVLSLVTTSVFRLYGLLLGCILLHLAYQDVFGDRVLLWSDSSGESLTLLETMPPDGLFGVTTAEFVAAKAFADRRRLALRDWTALVVAAAADARVLTDQLEAERERCRRRRLLVLAILGSMAIVVATWAGAAILIASLVIWPIARFLFTPFAYLFAHVAKATLRKTIAFAFDVFPEASFVVSSDEAVGLRVEARGLTVPFFGRFDYGADVPMSERHVDDIKRGRRDRLVRLVIALAVVVGARLPALKQSS